MVQLRSSPVPPIAAFVDPKSRFDDDTLLYTNDNMQVNDYQNIEEREDAIRRAWDMYDLNAEVNPTSSNPFWKDSWNEIATGIISDQHYLRTLRKNQENGYHTFDESDDDDDSDSSFEDSILPEWVPDLRDTAGKLDLLSIVIFMTFFAVICGLQACPNFRMNYCDISKCFKGDSEPPMELNLDTPFDIVWESVVS